DYDSLVDLGNKGKQFNIEFLVISIYRFFGFPTSYLRYGLVIFEKESIDYAKTYKDMKLQDKVSNYFDKKPVTEYIHIIVESIS
ncbi:479_t:CDS:2, partial [Scutellospora calospora]